MIEIDSENDSAEVPLGLNSLLSSMSRKAKINSHSEIIVSTSRNETRKVMLPRQMPQPT